MAIYGDDIVTKYKLCMSLLVTLNYGILFTIGLGNCGIAIHLLVTFFYIEVDSYWTNVFSYSIRLNTTHIHDLSCDQLDLTGRRIDILPDGSNNGIS